MSLTINLRLLLVFAVIVLAALSAAPAVAQTPPQILGAIPPGGGVALVTSSADATPTEVVTASEQAGCTTRSVWLGQGGSLIGYVVGAPSFVNAGFPALVPAGALLLLCDGPAPVAPPTVVAPGLSCPLLPANNIWNTRIDDLPVHAQSTSWIATIGATSQTILPVNSAL